MNPSPTTTSDLADKKYNYRYYSWTLLIVSLVVNGLLTLEFVWLAITSNRDGLWFCVFVFFMMFLYWGWVAWLDTRNKFIITVSQTGIHVPIIWKRGTAVYLPFSSFSTIEIIKVRKDTILKLSMGKKIHIIVESFFPQRQDFKELIGIVQQRSPIPFS